MHVVNTDAPPPLPDVPVEVPPGGGEVKKVIIRRCASQKSAIYQLLLSLLEDSWGQSLGPP